MSIAITGCAGGSTVRTGSSSATALHRLVPYQLPIVTSRAVEAATNRANASRNAQNSVGNVPTVNGTASVALVDAPLFGVTQINLAIMGVNALSGTTATPIVAYDSDVIVDVLDYKTSALALGSASIPAQAYDGLQLVIDPTQSTVVANGQTYPLSFGTMQHGTFVASSAPVQSIDYPLPFSQSTGSVSLILDFNAEQSIRHADGGYAVAPYLGGAPQASAAIIAGSLVSANGMPVQGATAVVTDPSGTVVAVAPSDENGNFQIHAIPAGSYSVSIQNAFTTNTGMQVLASDGRTDTLPPLQVNVPAGDELELGQISD
jgi:hypothetical protein